MRYQGLIAAIISGFSQFVYLAPVSSAVLDVRFGIILPSDFSLILPAEIVSPKDLPLSSPNNIARSLTALIPPDSNLEHHMTDVGNYARQLRYPLVNPVPVSSSFGRRIHPISGILKNHTGIDFAAEQGTPVVAAQSGRVIYVGDYGGYGNVVVIQHSSHLYTLYAHLSEQYAERDAWVESGTTIALVGNTGASTGPHLHFEVRIIREGSWYAVDPAYFLASHSR